MGYDADDVMVRVDFFKPSGKWYTTEAVRWSRYHGREGGQESGRIILIQDAFREALHAHLFDAKTGRTRLAGMTAVCLEPHHEHAHPLMVKVPGEDGV